MASFQRAIIYCDGASRGNPGEASAGVAIWDANGAPAGRISLYLGRQTNNQAEYKALLAGLVAAAVQGLTDVEFRLDSELVVKQLNGEYKIKDRQLGELAAKVRKAAEAFIKVTYVHVPRGQNRQADELANEALEHRAKF